MKLFTQQRVTIKYVSNQHLRSIFQHRPQLFQITNTRSIPKSSTFTTLIEDLQTTQPHNSIDSSSTNIKQVNMQSFFTTAVVFLGVLLGLAFSHPRASIPVIERSATTYLSALSTRADTMAFAFDTAKGDHLVLHVPMDGLKYQVSALDCFNRDTGNRAAGCSTTAVSYLVPLWGSSSACCSIDFNKCLKLGDILGGGFTIDPAQYMDLTRCQYLTDGVCGAWPATMLHNSCDKAARLGELAGVEEDSLAPT